MLNFGSLLCLINQKRFDFEETLISDRRLLCPNHEGTRANI